MSHALASRLRGFAAGAPFLLFVTVFLLIPVAANVYRSFVTEQGQFNPDLFFSAVSWQLYLPLFIDTAKLAGLSAVIGGALGLVLAWALHGEGTPGWLKKLVMSYSALASQSGGVQLAFAFIAALGSYGLVTVAIESLIPGALSWFSITSFSGVTVVYLYFQVPLMAVMMLPAIGAVKREWAEAASSLGATGFAYFKDVIVPVLWPPVLGSLLLLFANAFAAYATVYALTGGSMELIPLAIGRLIGGDVFSDPGMAAALVTWTMIIIAVALGVRFALDRKATAWLNT